LGTDQDTNKYNHFFYLPKEYKNTSNINTKNLCYICKDVFEKHENYLENLQEITGTQESHFKLLNEMEDSNENDEVLIKIKNKNIQSKLDKAYILKLEKEFEKENLCFICYANEITPQSSISLECKHLFCKDCVKKYLESKINDANINNLKCLHPGCKLLYSEMIIQKTIDQNIFHRYLVNKNRDETKHRLQNGFIPCTYPDCQELVFYKDGNNPLVFCAKKHKFCAKCKEGWHKYTECKNVI
jgi:hypothetical protein